MQTERVTFLASPKDKAFLTRRAAEEGVSVGEFVRRRALQADGELSPEDEAELRVLTAEVNRLVPEMAAMLDEMSMKLRSTHQQVDRMLREMDAR